MTPWAPQGAKTLGAFGAGRLAPAAPQPLRELVLFAGSGLLLGLNRGDPPHQVARLHGVGALGLGCDEPERIAAGQ
jgi:hypothetical protein